MSHFFDLCRCPRCSAQVVHIAGSPRPIVCPECLRHFLPPAPSKVPNWVWGVLGVLIVNLFIGY